MKIPKKQRFPLHFALIIILLGISSCALKNPLKKGDKENIQINNLSANDTSISKMIVPYKEELAIAMGEVLNVSEVNLVKGRPESNLGNFIADLSYSVCSAIYYNNNNEDIDFCLLNEGGLRASIAKGPITLGNVYELMPFENEMVIITLDYKHIIELFNYLITSGGEPISKASLLIVNNKIESILINGSIPEPDRVYNVLTTDYLARGGDKMNFFLDPVKEEKIGIKLRDAIILYLKEEAIKGNTVNAEIEGRIRYE